MQPENFIKAEKVDCQTLHWSGWRRCRGEENFNDETTSRDAQSFFFLS